MSKLILIKHSLPQIEPLAPAEEWELGAEGLRRCAALADALAPHLPAALFSSREPKAQATAAALGQRWALAAVAADGLEEQHRRTAPYLGEPAFQQRMAEFFQRPSQRVFGEESADAAHARFAAAVDRLLAERPGETIMAVTHGTVMSLYISRAAGVEPFALWSQLGLPSFVVLDRATLAIVELRATVG